MRWLCRERAASVVPAEPATHDTQFVGKAKTMPSTLYMDGTSPVTVFIRATTDELRQLHNQTVTLAAVAAVDGEAPAVGGEEREGVFGKPYDMDDPA